MQCSTTASSSSPRAVYTQKIVVSSTCDPIAIPRSQHRIIVHPRRLQSLKDPAPARMDISAACRIGQGHVNADCLTSAGDKYSRGADSRRLLTVLGRDVRCGGFASRADRAVVM
ncbi:hypothetical protein PSPO01_06901 [Paraphaeosphaeria sporulosa]